MGQKKATMTDVAKLSGVSQSTVSLVLNQKSRGAIPPETVSKVLSAAQALHYTKPPRARSQARSEQSVLVLASDPTNPYYSFLLHELDLAAAPHDLHLIFCSTYHNAQREAAFLEIALNSSFQAAIFLYPPDAPAYASQVSCQMPVIAICDKNAVSDIDLIELDNFRAGSIAAEHLVSLGHRNIALISSDPSKSLARSNRIQGVTWQMERCGLRDHLRVVVPGPDEIEHAPGNDIGYRIGRAVAQRPELLSGTYTAFISINDMVAMGVIDALSQHNAQFPGNYSIVSFDNVLYTGLSRISLTTVDYHINLLAQAAIDLLLPISFYVVPVACLTILINYLMPLGRSGFFTVSMAAGYLLIFVLVSRFHHTVAQMLYIMGGGLLLVLAANLIYIALAPQKEKATV